MGLLEDLLAKIREVKVLGRVTLVTGTLATDRSSEAFSKAIGRHGRVIALRVIELSGSARRGQTHITIMITGQRAAGDEVRYVLYSGYQFAPNLVFGNGSIPVTNDMLLYVGTRNSLASHNLEVQLLIADEDGATPNWQSWVDVETQGFVRIIATADPAANAEVAAETVPTAAMWRPLGYGVSMAQGLTDTPRPALDIVAVGDFVVCRIPVEADVAASTTVYCSWGRASSNVANNVDTGSMHAPLPDIPMLSSWYLSTQTQGRGANSNYGAASVAVEEFIQQ